MQSPKPRQASGLIDASRIHLQPSGFSLPSLVPTAFALWYVLVIAAWAASAYRQLLLRKHMIAMPSWGTYDPYVELAYAASLGTAAVSAVLLASLLVLGKCCPMHRWASDRYLVAANVVTLLLVTADFVVLAPVWERSYFRSFDIPGPAIYVGSVIAPFAATAITLVRLRCHPG